MARLSPKIDCVPDRLAASQVPFESKTSDASHEPLQRIATIASLIILMLFQTGCSQSLHRRMTIKSDPPGALVLMEGEEVGYTPVSVDFNHYGTREITLIKDGYETLTAMQKVRTPWYQRMPFDFFTDNLSPVRIKDNSEYTFTMNRQEIVSNDQLLQRAKGLRSQAQVIPANPSK